MKNLLLSRLLIGLVCLLPVTGFAQEPAEDDVIGVEAQVALEVPAAAEAGPDFDAVRATQAYLGLLSDEQKAQSDAYFEGGYWLLLWGFLYEIGIAALLLFTGFSAWLRDRTQRTRFHGLNGAFYGAGYIVATFALALPLAIYTDYFREHAYGLSNLTFSAWLGDEFTGLLVGIVLGMLLIGVLYAVFRRTPRTWWVWGSVVAVTFLIFAATIAPVYISPLFNDYKPLPEGPVRASILSMARANQVPADNVYWFDASKQSTRISANVSGFAGTTRISLNDNLLTRSPHASIDAVMGHELGHYVLNHGPKHIISFGLVLLIGFGFVAATFNRTVRRFGASWGVRGIEDPAGLPLLVALFAVYFFLATPVTNSIIRVAEVESDIFGLNAARAPDGFALVAMQLSEYRKIQPGYWEELLFFDHPSGYNRVRMAMEWKAENIESLQEAAAEDLPAAGMPVAE